MVPDWLIRSADGAWRLPNTACRCYQRERGVTVARAGEKIRAVAATEEDAELIAAPPGTPLLEIDRIARDLQGRAVERRISRCKAENCYYLSKLG